MCASIRKPARNKIFSWPETRLASEQHSTYKGYKTFARFCVVCISVELLYLHCIWFSLKYGEKIIMTDITICCTNYG